LTLINDTKEIKHFIRWRLVRLDPSKWLYYC